MSNALAVATVSAALLWTLQEALPSARITIGRPVKPADNEQAPVEVYIYLYQVTPNAAFRNADLPTRDAQDGRRTQRAQAALDLHYLLVFYGDQSQLQPERNLGAAVRRLHEQPILTRDAIHAAIANQASGGGFQYDYRDALADSNLADAIEAVRLVPSSLSLDDLSKLWSVFFQTAHGLSVAYQASVVLIESEDAGRQAAPVLRRGADDQGVDTSLALFPSLDDYAVYLQAEVNMRPRPLSFPSAQLGLTLVLTGRNLGGDTLQLRLAHPERPPLGLLVPANQRTATEIIVPMDDAAPADPALDRWAAGVYRRVIAEITLQGATRARVSNTLAFTLAPRIVDIAPLSPIALPGSGDVILTITCRPAVQPAQQATLLLGDREIEAEPHPGATYTLAFVIHNAPTVQDQIVYLRVDGVNSMPFTRTGTPPRLAFDDSQKVTIV